MKIKNIIYNIVKQYQLSTNKDLKNIYNDIIKIQKNKINVEDKNRILSYVKGIIKYDLYLNWLIKFSNKKTKNRLKIILKIILYEIFIIKNKEYSVIDDWVGFTKKRFSFSESKFINWSARNTVKNRKKIKQKLSEITSVKRLSIKYSIPVWIIEQQIKLRLNKYEIIRILRSFNKPQILFCNNFHISRNELITKIEHEEIKAELINEPVKTCKIIDMKKKVSDVLVYKNGNIYIQNISSMIAQSIMGLNKNDTVLDLCCAPGGYLTGYFCKDNSVKKVIGIDKSKKIFLANDNIARLKLNNISLVQADITNIKFKKIFKKVVLDAPCLGIGVLCKYPESRYIKNYEQLLKISSIQRKILNAAKDFVEDNGMLYYSVCSLTKNETDDIIEKFLETNNNFKRLFIEKNIESYRYIKKTKFGYLILPDKIGTEGYYISILKRVKK